MAADTARERTRAADAERAAGRDRGPLRGIPITLKDRIAPAGLRPTAGSRQLAAFPKVPRIFLE